MKKVLSVLATAALSTVVYSQLNVSTTPSNKNVIIEDLTGIHCGYCPDGALKADQLRASLPGRIFIIGNHAGSYANPGAGEPDFRTTYGAVINSMADPSGYPAGTINRRVFSTYSMKSGKAAMSRSYWGNAAGVVVAEPGIANMAVEAYYYASKDMITINVAVYFTDDAPSPQYLNIAVLQDSIVGYQSDYGPYYPQRRLNPADANTYVHMDVLRDYITGQYGEAISNTLKGTKFEKTYTYTLSNLNPPYNLIPYVMKHMRVLAFLTSSNSYSDVGTATYTPAKEKSPVGIQDEVAVRDVNIYPNPFQENATISFDLKESTALNFRVMDVTGKMVYEVGRTTYNPGNNKIIIDGSDLVSGLYFVNIISDSGVSTRKIVLNR